LHSRSSRSGEPFRIPQIESVLRISRWLVCRFLLKAKLLSLNPELPLPIAGDGTAVPPRAGQEAEHL
jgi:hypothetical protein